MGCDISFFVECKTRYNRDKAISEVFDIEGEVDYIWESVDKWTDNPEYGKKGTRSMKEPVRILDPKDAFYSGRDYDLFEVLGLEFSSTVYKSPFTLKGIPVDLSVEVKDELKYWSDGHSHSYLTLKELVDNRSHFAHFPVFLNTIEKLKKLDTNYENVRVFFFFDN